MNISIKGRLLVLSVLPATLLAVILLLVNSHEMKQLSDVQQTSAQESLNQLKKDELTAYMEMAFGAVEALYKSGASLEEAMPIFKGLKYGKSGYIFGYTGDGTRVFMGQLDKGIGTNFWDLKDANGTYLIRDLIAAGKKGGGFVTYHFPKPGETKPEPKLSYALFLDRWNLMIGTGFYLDDVNGILTELKAETDAARTGILTYLGILSVVLVVAAVIFGVSIGRSIMTPLRRITDSMAALSQGQGDLTFRMNYSERNELGKLADSFDRFIESLESMIRSVRETSDRVAGDSGAVKGQLNHIGELVHDQHMETDQAATAMNEMSAAAQEVARSAAETADAARQVDANARTASEVVERSRSVVEGLAKDIDRSNAAIAELEGSVQDISSVVGVIQGIAEQTNLLALNAAIEAARAGEQGRGFAVVADEVRSLATKTHASTEEIQQMIQRLGEESQKAVGAMRKSHDSSGEAVNMSQSAQDELRRISDGIHRVMEMSDVIATAADEQNHVSDDINQRIVAIADQSTRSATYSKEADQRANALAEEASTLKSLVSRFKVSG